MPEQATQGQYRELPLTPKHGVMLTNAFQARNQVERELLLVLNAILAGHGIDGASATDIQLLDRNGPVLGFTQLPDRTPDAAAMNGKAPLLEPMDKAKSRAVTKALKEGLKQSRAPLTSKP